MQFCRAKFALSNDILLDKIMIIYCGENHQILTYQILQEKIFFFLNQLRVHSVCNSELFMGKLE